MNAYGIPRATKDLDVLIRADLANASRVFAALAAFGAPLQGLSEQDFAHSPQDIFQIGIEPNRVDILQSISGVQFEDAWARQRVVDLGQGLMGPLIHKDDLIANKTVAGRPRDLADAAELREMPADDPHLR